MKNCIRPPYEKLKSLKSGFIENSNFENNRDPWPALLPPKWVWKRRFISGFQQGMCSSWEMSVFQLLVNQNSLWPRPRLETLLLGTATLAWWNAPVVHLAHPVPTWYVRRPSRAFWDWAESHKELFLHNSPCADSRLFTNIQRFGTCWFILRLSFDVQGS